MQPFGNYPRGGNAAAGSDQECRGRSLSNTSVHSATPDGAEKPAEDQGAVEQPIYLQAPEPALDPAELAKGGLRSLTSPQDQRQLQIRDARTYRLLDHYDPCLALARMLGVERLAAGSRERLDEAMKAAQIST